MSFCVNFDLDGTLINSMNLNLFCWSQIFKKNKIKINKNDYFLNEGLKGKDLLKLFSKKYNFKIENKAKSIWEEKDKIFLKNYKFKPYPNTIKLLSKLKNNNIKTSIVTAGNAMRVKKILPLSFQKYFDVILTSEDYNKSKPHPECYIKACKLLDCDPKKSFVVENAPLGISAGKKAGCTTLAITNTLDYIYLKEANLVFNNFSKIFFLSNINI